MSESIRLRIAHILIAMTAVAGMAAWSQACSQLQYANASETPPILEPTRNLWWALVQGGLLSGLLFLWSNFRHTNRWIHHPGHWVLLLNAIPIPVILTVHTIRSLQINWYGARQTAWLSYAYPDLAYLVIHLAASVMWIYAIRNPCKANHPWPLVLILFFCISSLQCLDLVAHAVGGINPLWSFRLPLQTLILVVLSVAVTHDTVMQVHRDWLLWLAAALTYIAFVSNLAIQFLAN